MTASPVDQFADDPADALAAVLAEVERLVAGVRDEQWAAPTPCADWTVRDLVNHLVAGNRLFAAALGDDPPPVEHPLVGTPEHLGDRPAAAYRAAADAVVAAFRRPGVLARMCTVPFGSVPGIVALHLRSTEVLVHGWDLARATGQTVRFPEGIAERELVFTRDKLADVPPERSPFGPPQPVADDAPAIDRLAACLGRAVTP